MVLPRDRGERRLGLRVGGAQDEHLDRARGRPATAAASAATCSSSVTSALKASARPPVVADGAHDLCGAVADVVDGDGQAVAGEPPRNGPGERARAARHKGDARAIARRRTRRAAPLRATSTTCG